jgi:hypothetical protein
MSKFGKEYSHPENSDSQTGVLQKDHLHGLKHIGKHFGNERKPKHESSSMLHLIPSYKRLKMNQFFEK